MSYVRKVGDMMVTVVCASDPEATYETYYNDIERKILADGYKVKTSMENLISMIILSFDCDDNYGEYDEETAESMSEAGGSISNIPAVIFNMLHISPFQK